jgi:N-acyl-D-amino-acid deacylase
MTVTRGANPGSRGHLGNGRPADTVITCGLVIDGTGAPGRVRDVAITGDTVTAVGTPRSLAGRTQIDATGLVVTPGFVDIHSHADMTMVVDARAQSALLQGVTSLVTGNCGYGAAPVGQASLDVVTANAPGSRVADLEGLSWNSFPEYMEVLRSGGIGVNVFPLVGHGALRLATVGTAPREADRRELLRMGSLLMEAMQAGAAGFSTGLETAPGKHATRPELAALAEVTGAADGLYATHCRNRTDRIEAAAREAVAISAAGGCRLQMSHFVPRPSWPGRDAYRRALDVCREGPSGVLFDVFPFAHGPTPVIGMLADWARSGDREEVAGRLRDPRLRERLLASLDNRFTDLARSGAAADTYVICDAVDGRFVGRTLAELAEGDPAAVVLDLLAAAGADYPEVTVLEPWALADDLCGALGEPDYLVMGDGVTGSLDGPSACRAFSLSDWGWVTRMLGTYVRDRALTSIESAVHRMTLGPARQAGILDRGRLEAGARADIAVFEIAALHANHDPAHPGMPPAGIRDVFVNGRHAVRSGRLTGELAGQVGLQR